MFDFFGDIDNITEEAEFEALAEAFKGKSKPILELEKMIGENRKKYYGTFKVGGGYYTDKDFVKIGDKIAKIFNLKVVDFNLVNDPGMNAFTVPAGFSMAANSNFTNSIVTKKKETMEFKYDNLSAVIRVTSGLWTSKEFTDGEVTAIILHEIGHNFQHEVNSGLKTYAICMYFVRMFNFISVLLTGNIPSAIAGFISSDSALRAGMNKFAKDSGIGPIINICGGIIGFVRIIVYEILELIGRATLGIPTGAITMASLMINAGTNPIGLLVGMLTTPIGKGGENVSDVFAAEHGYGPELVSALAKMELDPDASATMVGRISKKMPLFDSICTMFALPLMIVSFLFEEHPRTGKRAQNIVYELEKDLEKSDVSPAMKKEIKKQIEEVKEAVDSYTKVSSPMEGMALRKALFTFGVNYDKDPKGFMTKALSQKNLIEAFTEADLDLFSRDEDINLSDYL